MAQVLQGIAVQSIRPVVNSPVVIGNSHCQDIRFWNKTIKLAKSYSGTKFVVKRVKYPEIALTGIKIFTNSSGCFFNIVFLSYKLKTENNEDS
jgi:hypothetical protein